MEWFRSAETVKIENSSPFVKSIYMLLQIYSPLFLHFITIMYASANSSQFGTSTKCLLRDVGTFTPSETNSHIQ